MKLTKFINTWISRYLLSPKFPNFVQNMPLSTIDPPHSLQNNIAANKSDIACGRQNNGSRTPQRQLQRAGATATARGRYNDSSWTPERQRTDATASARGRHSDGRTQRQKHAVTRVRPFFKVFRTQPCTDRSQ